MNDVFVAIDENNQCRDKSFFSATCSEKWCLDSGSTAHICKDKLLFTNSYEIKSGVNLASNATAEVTAKGDVQIIVNKTKSDEVEWHRRLGHSN